MCNVHGVAVSGDAGSPLGPARSTSLCAYVSALYGPIGPATAHATGALILSPGTSRSTEVPAGVTNYPPKSKHSTLKNSTFEVASQLGKRCVSLTLSGRWLRHRSGLRWRLVKVGGPERQSPCQEATERPEIPCYILLQTRYLSACYLTP